MGSELSRTAATAAHLPRRHDKSSILLHMWWSGTAQNVRCCWPARRAPPPLSTLCCLGPPCSVQPTGCACYPRVGIASTFFFFFGASRADRQSLLQGLLTTQMPLVGGCVPTRHEIVQPAEQHRERARVRLRQGLLEKLLLDASATPSAPSALLVDFLEHGMMLGLRHLLRPPWVRSQPCT
jgi:hypothetical protein